MKDTSARARLPLAALLLALPGFVLASKAQVFGPVEPGDLVATFRKTGTHQGTYEMIARIGNVTNFLAMSQGSMTNISTYTPTQLLQAFPDGYADLQWGVFSAFEGPTAWATPLGPFPQATLWYTLGTPDASTTTNAPDRQSVQAQGGMRQYILSMVNAANLVSVGSATNQNLATSVVIELASDTFNNITAFIGDNADPSLGDFHASLFPISFEGTSPDSFTAPNRCDFFQCCPGSTRFGGVNTDPITLETNGPPYRVGFFLLQPDGTMTFTRQSTNSVVTPPSPPPPVLSVSSMGGTTTISFATTNGATYTLLSTNSSGLSSPPNTWGTLGTLTGDGTTKSFTDTSSDAERFYRVSAR